MSQPLDKLALAKLQSIALLYVEDEEDIRAGTARCLKRHLGTYYEACNGSEGLAAYRRYRPDIVVTDVTMPIMDGLEMAKAIREEDPEVPVIVVSAHNELDFFVQAVEIGIDSYLLKPTNLHTLLNQVVKHTRPILRQRELDSQSKLIRHLLELSPSPMMVASAGRPEQVNQAFLDYLGCTSENELLSRFPGADEHLDAIGIQYGELDTLHQVLRSGNRNVSPRKVARVDLPSIGKSVFALTTQ